MNGARVKTDRLSFRRYTGDGHNVRYRHWHGLRLYVAGPCNETIACDQRRAKGDF